MILIINLKVALISGVYGIWAYLWFNEFKWTQHLYCYQQTFTCCTKGKWIERKWYWHKRNAKNTDVKNWRIGALCNSIKQRKWGLEKKDWVDWKK